jgi:uncharacterized membrane protein (UPF0182 family)
MRYDPDEPDLVLTEAGERRPLPSRRLILLLALLFLGFLFVHNAVPLYTDWLWFGEVGYRNVFTTIIAAKSLLFFGFGLFFFAVFYWNVRHARRLAPEETDRFLMQQFGPQWGGTLQRGIGWILLGISLFLALWVGRLSAEYWQHWLQFVHWTPFHVQDPVFHNDVGFYILRLPFLNVAWQFVFYTLCITTIAVVVIHWADRALESLAGLPNVAPRVRGHLLALLAALAAVGAVGYWLSLYDLLTNDNGVFSGAGYVDLHYRKLAIYVQVFLLAATALSCLVTIWRPRALRLSLIGAGAWVVAMIVLGGLVPGAMQKIYVEPNQFLAERDYIADNIRFTRLGFNLENVRVLGFPAEESLTAAGLQTNRDTLDNVRLWDYQFLDRVYGQLQTVKSYYRFQQDTPDGNSASNIDIDRYTIGGRLRQVMLAAREMDPSGLRGAQTWQNTRLAYTHGYGLVMSPVNKIVDGGPDYFVEGIPPTISPEASNLTLTQPDIYYGQLADNYVFVDTAQQEFDYPSTDSSSANGQADMQDHYTHYQGRGGIRIGDSPLAKLAFSLRLGDANVLLARGFTANTRVLFRRDIRERVQTIAPFLQQDGDPYLVLTPEGRLVWILDCYTLSDRYPYSTPYNIAVTDTTDVAPNYIRNSVKAVVDAYDGTVSLYLADPKDPIAQTFSKIFPGLFKPLNQMPTGLHAHIRYPEDLFRIQRSVYAVYHVDDPRVFYLKEDAWAIPVEPNTSTGDDNPAGSQTGRMEPYYVIMRLPPGTDGPGLSDLKEEFLLMSPLAPINRESQNILGWMAARCDSDKYGQLVLYRFPQKISVNGPSQIVALINSDPSISKELTLLGQVGSKALFGNLLVIPIEKSLLYITPLYVEAANAASKLPQLQRVVVAFGQRVAMGKTLEEALATLFSGYNAPNAPETTSPPGTAQPSQPTGPPSNLPAGLRALIHDAGAQYDAAQQKLKAGDFAGYGAATKELEQTLKELNRAAGNPLNAPRR